MAKICDECNKIENVTKYMWLCVVCVAAAIFYTLRAVLRCLQTTTDLAGSLLCFNPIGAILRCTFWSVPTGTKILSDH